MDRPWPQCNELRRYLSEDAPAARKTVRALVDAAGGSLAEMARLTASNRVACWRLLERAGLLPYQRQVQQRHARYFRRGIDRGAGWVRAYEARLAAL